MILYEGNLSYEGSLLADFTMKLLFGALRVSLNYDGALDGGLFLFGKKLKTAEELVEKVSSSIKAKRQTHEKPSDKEDEAAPESENQTGDISEATADKTGSRVKKLLREVLPNCSEKLQSTLKDVIKKTGKQLLPRKMTGSFEFGFEDPYYTGKLLEIFAILYAAMGDDLKVVPVWDRRCFKGRISFNGCIHLTVILWQALRLVFNREFRKIWRELNGR